LYELGQGYYEKLFYSYFFVMKNLESGSGTISGSSINLNAGSGTPLKPMQIYNLNPLEVSTEQISNLNNVENQNYPDTLSYLSSAFECLGALWA
jgi:hypothetical protein